MTTKGKIISILGQIVEIEFLDNMPLIHHMLYLEENPKIKFEVYTSSGQNTQYCLLFTDPIELKKGMIVINSGEPMKVPMCLTPLVLMVAVQMTEPAMLTALWLFLLLMLLTNFAGIVANNAMVQTHCFFQEYKM